VPHFRVKNLVEKSQHPRKYLATHTGIKTMTVLSVIQKKVIKPFFARNGKLETGRKPVQQHSIDIHYEKIQREFQGLFEALKIAA